MQDSEKEAYLSLIHEARRAGGNLFDFVRDNTMADPRVSTETKTEELIKILKLNLYGGLKDAVADVCADQKKKNELKRLLQSHSEALDRLYVPDEYMSFVNEIHTAAYAAFRQEPFTQEIIERWRAIAPEFIDQKTGEYTSLSKSDTEGVWLIDNKPHLPSVSPWGQKRLIELGLTAQSFASLSERAASCLAHEWNKCFKTSKIPTCLVRLQSSEYPADAYSVTHKDDGSFYYTVQPDHIAMADLRELFHNAFHEPEHVFQIVALNPEAGIVQKNHPLYDAITMFSSAKGLGLFCANDVFAVDNPEDQPFEERLGAIAYSLYRKVPIEITAHQHGFLAELQLHKETGIPIAPRLRETLRKGSRSVAAIPPSLMPRG